PQSPTAVAPAQHLSLAGQNGEPRRRCSPSAPQWPGTWQTPQFAILNHAAIDSGIPRESATQRLGIRPSPAKLGCDPLAVLALARRIRWSICAPHADQVVDVGVTLFLEVPFRQLWCITSLSGKKCPRFDWAPPGVVCATPAGLGIRSFSRERSRWWQGSSPPERRNLNP